MASHGAGLVIGTWRLALVLHAENHGGWKWDFPDLDRAGLFFLFADSKLSFVCLKCVLFRVMHFFLFKIKLTSAVLLLCLQNFLLKNADVRVKTSLLALRMEVLRSKTLWVLSAKFVPPLQRFLTLGATEKWLWGTELSVLLWPSGLCYASWINTTAPPLVFLLIDPSQRG